MLSRKDGTRSTPRERTNMDNELAIRRALEYLKRINEKHMTGVLAFLKRMAEKP